MVEVDEQNRMQSRQGHFCRLDHNEKWTSQTQKTSILKYACGSRIKNSQTQAFVW